MYDKYVFSYIYSRGKYKYELSGSATQSAMREYGTNGAKL